MLKSMLLEFNSTTTAEASATALRRSEVMVGEEKGTYNIPLELWLRRWGLVVTVHPCITAHTAGMTRRRGVGCGGNAVNW